MATVRTVSVVVGEHGWMRSSSSSPTVVPDGYDLEDVLALRGQTFGLEIEFVGGDIVAIGQELLARGLSAGAAQLDPHSRDRVAGLWTLEKDDGVAGELVSPVLTDTPESWRQIVEVCGVLRRHGARPSILAGGHIHVGAAESGIADDGSPAIERLGRLCLWGEDVIFRLMSGSDKLGSLHRGAFRGYQKSGPMTLFPELTVLRAMTVVRGAVHLHHINRPRTLEFRYPDATLDPWRIQQHVRLACGLVAAAGRLNDGEIPSRTVALGTHWLSGRPGKNDLFAQFVSRVFTDARARDRMQQLYAITAWQPPLDLDRALAIHPLSDRALMRIAESDRRAQRSLAMRPNLPEAVAVKLATSPHRSVRRVLAQRNTVPGAAYELLLGDRDPTVRRLASRVPGAAASIARPAKVMLAAAPEDRDLAVAIAACMPDVETLCVSPTGRSQHLGVDAILLIGSADFLADDTLWEYAKDTLGLARDPVGCPAVLAVYARASSWPEVDFVSQARPVLGGALLSSMPNRDAAIARVALEVRHAAIQHRETKASADRSLVAARHHAHARTGSAVAGVS